MQQAPGYLQGHLVETVAWRQGRSLEQPAGRQSEGGVGVPPLVVVVVVAARVPPALPLLLLLQLLLLLLVLFGGTTQIVQPEEVHRHSGGQNFGDDVKCSKYI